MLSIAFQSCEVHQPLFPPLSRVAAKLQPSCCQLPIWSGFFLLPIALSQLPLPFRGIWTFIAHWAKVYQLLLPTELSCFPSNFHQRCTICHCLLSWVIFLAFHRLINYLTLSRNTFYCRSRWIDFDCPWFQLFSIVLWANWLWLPPWSEIFLIGLSSKSNLTTPWPELILLPFRSESSPLPASRADTLSIIQPLSWENYHSPCEQNIFVIDIGANLFSNTSWALYSQLSFELNIF